jgi:putative transposase
MVKFCRQTKTNTRKGAVMKKIVQITKKGKVKEIKSEGYPSLQSYGILDLDSKVSLIQELIPIGLMYVKEELENELVRLTGKWYSREGGVPGYSRWTRQRGSVYVGRQKIPVVIQRVRDTINNKEVPLESYQKLQQPVGIDESVMKKVLHGLSCRNYEDCADAIPQAFSLSPSSISRRFIRASRKKLQELLERRLGEHDIIALVIDGKTFGSDGIIMAVGVTLSGEKILLGIIQSGSENHVVCGDFLRGLVQRGLRYDKGLLCVIDGAKGFHKAVAEVFGGNGVTQRCQWHKRENVVSYLPKRLQSEFRKKLQAAYEKDDYDEAKEALEAVKKELKLINRSAVTSLEEGLEETLTLQRLGIPKSLRQSLKTTNMIESIHAQVGQKTDKVDYWKNSEQKQRWVATALLDIETRLRKVKGFTHLPELRAALMREVQRKEKGKEAVAA